MQIVSAIVGDRREHRKLGARKCAGVEADVAERYGKQLAHVEVRTRRGLNRVDALNNRLKDALARVRVEMRVATQQGMANEEAAKQAAAKSAAKGIL